MLGEGELDPNGKLFDEKLEKGYGGLGDIKFFIEERAGRSAKYEEAMEAIF